MGAHSAPKRQRREPVRAALRFTARVAVRVWRGARWVHRRISNVAAKARSWLDTRLPPTPDLNREPLSARRDLYPPLAGTPDPVSQTRPDLTAQPLVTQPPTLAARPTPHAAIALLHEHLDLPRDHVNWKVYDDGAYGEVDVLQGTEVQHRAIVCECAAAFSVDMVEHVREPAESGYGTVSASGTFAGVHLAVAAPILPDVSEALNTFTEATEDPSLDDPTTQQFAVVSLEDEDEDEEDDDTAEAVDAA